MKQNFEISHQQPLGYTVKDAIRLSHLGKTKFYALIKAGTIRTRRIGRNHFIPREELERLLAPGGGGEIRRWRAVRQAERLNAAP